MGAVDADRDELHVGALATEVVETAAELPDRFAGAPGALGEEDQRVLVAESFQHLLDGLAPLSLDRPGGASSSNVRSMRTASKTFRT